YAAPPGSGTGASPGPSRRRSRSISVTMRPCTSDSPAITPGARGTGRTPRRRATSRTSLACRPYHSERASNVMIGSCTCSSRPSAHPDPCDQILERVGRLRQLLRRGRHLLHGGGLLLGGRGRLLGARGVVLGDLRDLLDRPHQTVGPLGLRLGER